MVNFIICFFAAMLFIYCHTVRQFVLHPFKFTYYLVKDIVLYFVRRKRHLCPTGEISAYVAHFGRGKTLSATAHLTALYRRYNNKRVWDRDRRQMVTQKIEILSNVDFLCIPSVPLLSMADISARAAHNKEIDLEQGTLTVTLVLVDEASAQLNSRDYRNNFDADTINTLVTCRHYHLSLFYTTQKFKFADALLRGITQQCIKCHKFWRIQKLYGYNADQVEIAGDTTLVKPIYTRSFFVTDKHYNNYDTLATVDKLVKDAKDGKMMSAQEILAARGNAELALDAVTRPSRRLRRMRRGDKG
ncbi:MAG: hypothetical protein K2H85_06755 [Allobaculum sp.]|nr:hypothetical protein [Allobaculum sp.]